MDDMTSPREGAELALDGLLADRDRLMADPGTLGTREALAALLPEIWRRGGDVLNYARLVIGEAVDDYCRLELWRVPGYSCFKEAWEAEGDPDTSYNTVLLWRYAAQCQRGAGLTLEAAAVQPIRKLVRANATMRTAKESGEDVGEMVRDLADPDVSADAWRDRHATHVRPEELIEYVRKDRVTLEAATGRITYWHNGRKQPVGVPMGRALLDGDAEEAWVKVTSGEVRVEWL